MGLYGNFTGRANGLAMTQTEITKPIKAEESDDGPLPSIRATDCKTQKPQ